ncbi:hypothetical protein B0H14DRAFT_2568307 [Mycena olivaceomarginata]|nr:hypothetical protein B0H14DRAFT_2568307 [Mycena olivaceomarginata]
MPEKGDIGLFLREINGKSMSSSRKRYIETTKMTMNTFLVSVVCTMARMKAKYLGCFVTHPECCARVSGNRQTFTTHVTPPNDPNLEPLLHLRPAAPPKKKGKGMKPAANTAASQPRFYCPTCHTLADVEEEEDDNDVGGCPYRLDQMPAPVLSDLRNDRTQQAAYLPNYAVETAGGKNNITLYTPFLAQGGPGWPKELMSSSRNVKKQERYAVVGPTCRHSPRGPANKFPGNLNPVLKVSLTSSDPTESLFTTKKK